MKILFVFILAISCLVKAQTSLETGKLQVYHNSRGQYSLSVPQGWIHREQKIPGHSEAQEFISPRHEGSLLIMTAEIKANCHEVLTNLETERKLKNTLSLKEREVSAPELKSAHAKEGARGHYEFAAIKKAEPVEQEALCLAQDKNKQVLLATYRKKNGPERLRTVLKTFSFQEKEHSTQ